MTLTEIVKTLIYSGFEKFNRYYSNYRGFVADNQDPDGMQRVQLKVPQIYGNEVHEYWAFPKNVFMGPNHGSQVIPQIGDLVWVSFEHGDPKRPMYSLGHPGKDQVPDELRDPNIYWFKSPSGVLVGIDDNKKEVFLKDTHSNQILMTKKGISLATNNNIFLGNLNSAKENTTLGDTLKQNLKQEQNRVTAAISFLSTLGYTSVVPPGNFDNITATKVKIE